MLMEIISRKEAKAKNKTRFFTGAACPKGHICERMVSNTDCVECMSARAGKRYRSNREYREKVKAKRRNKYAENPQKFIERSKAAYQNNREDFKARSANRNARVRGCEGQITGDDILYILELQGYRCKYCATSLLEYYELDHAMPMHKHGPNIIENLQCLCDDCHKNKNAHEQRELNTKKDRA